MSPVKSILHELLQNVVSSPSSPSSSLSSFSEGIEKMLAEEILTPSSPSSSELSNNDPVNLDDSIEHDVYEDFAVKGSYVEENVPDFPIKRSYWSEDRQCVINLREGEYDSEFDSDIEINGNLHDSFSDFDTSNEFESSIGEFEEIEDGPAPKRSRRSSSKDDSERLLGDDDNEGVDDYLEN